jgi:surfeit locus 1 family protein
VLKKIFSRQWFLTTLLVVAAMAVMARLGIWQLDRLEGRRAFNTRVKAQQALPPLQLNPESISADLAVMEYREVVVTGEYEHSQEVALRNQAWQAQAGVHLLSPLVIEGSDQAVMVDRGWIPLEDFASGQWEQYAEPGVVEVRGLVRLSQDEPAVGGRQDTLPEPGERLEAWNFANLEAMKDQITSPILMVYIQQAPDESWTSLPYRSQPDFDLTEGPHMGYAVQWFTFATILGIGYPFFIRRETSKRISSELITKHENAIDTEAQTQTKDVDKSTSQKPLGPKTA